MASFPAFTKRYHKTAQPATEPTLPQNSAGGKVVLVTGGGRGIGFRIASAFTQAGAAHVVILGRSPGTLETAKAELEKISQSTTKIHSFVADVSSAADLTGAFASAVAATGGRGIDVCVANAGYSPDTLAPVRSQPMEEIWQTYEVNVRGLLHIVKAFLEHAAYDAAGTPDKRPVFIEINTGMAHLPYFGPFAAYASSKAAAAKVIEYVQAEEDQKLAANADADADASNQPGARAGVRLHNLQPGIIKTDLGSKADLPEETWDDISLPANFTTWLASPAASFLAGRFVWSNWDVEELLARRAEIEADPSLFTLTLGGWPFGAGGGK